MNTVVRTAAFAAVAFTVNATETWWLTRIQPEISTALALGQLNGNNANIQSLRWFEAEKKLVHTGAMVVLTGAAVLLFAEPARRAWVRHQRRLPIMLPVLFALLTTGCLRPYDVPEFGTIDTAETGLLIPLEGESLREVNRALSESQEDAMIPQIKQLAVEKARIEKWGGSYPQYYLAPSEKAGLLLQLPAAH